MPGNLRAIRHVICWIALKLQDEKSIKHLLPLPIHSAVRGLLNVDKAVNESDVHGLGREMCHDREVCGLFA